MDINSITLVGRVASDVELRYTQSGTAVGEFRIAVNGKPNGDIKPVSFFKVVVWGKTAENCNNYLNKGKQIAINGSLRQSRWTTESGERRSAVEITAAWVEFLADAKTHNSDLPK